MPPLSRLPVLVLAAALAGCGAVDATVTSACHSAELDLAIHAGAEGDGFLALSGLVAGTDGTAYLLDGGEGSLLAFAPEGDELWRVRGVEEGVPELADPAGLHRLGELLVFEDLAERRLAFWTEGGERAGALALDSLPLPGRALWVAAVGLGRVVAALEFEPDFEVDPWVFDEPAPAARRLALVLASAGRAAVDTLAVVELPREQYLRLPGYEIPVASPYAAQPTFAVSPEGLIALAAGSEYRVEVYRADGRRYAEIRGDDATPAISPADLRAFARLLPDTSMVAQLYFPEAHPAITALATTADGQLLIRTSWARREEVRWDRWTLEGEFVGSFMLPASMLLVTGVGDLVYGRAVDEIGAQHLTLYRLTGASRCPGPAALTLRDGVR
jgi:hypothetical protein